MKVMPKAGHVIAAVKMLLDDALAGQGGLRLEKRGCRRKPTLAERVVGCERVRRMAASSRRQRTASTPRRPQGVVQGLMQRSAALTPNARVLVGDFR